MRKTCQYWNRSPISKVNVTIGQFKKKKNYMDKYPSFQTYQRGVANDVFIRIKHRWIIKIQI